MKFFGWNPFILFMMWAYSRSFIHWEWWYLGVADDSQFLLMGSIFGTLWKIGLQYNDRVKYKITSLIPSFNMKNKPTHYYFKRQKVSSH